MPATFGKNFIFGKKKMLFWQTIFTFAENRMKKIFENVSKITKKEDYDALSAHLENSNTGSH